MSQFLQCLRLTENGCLSDASSSIASNGNSSANVLQAYCRKSKHSTNRPHLHIVGLSATATPQPPADLFSKSRCLPVARCYIIRPLAIMSGIEVVGLVASTLTCESFRGWKNTY
jgi:hypothetical protein